MGKRLGTSKDVERLADVARSHKWVVKVTNGNHLQFIPPDKEKQIVVHSLTTSDWRAYANLRSRLRQNGLDI